MLVYYVHCTNDRNDLHLTNSDVQFPTEGLNESKGSLRGGLNMPKRPATYLISVAQGTVAGCGGCPVVPFCSFDAKELCLTPVANAFRQSLESVGLGKWTRPDRVA
jgi:hypothetical protein